MKYISCLFIALAITMFCEAQTKPSSINSKKHLTPQIKRKSLNLPQAIQEVKPSVVAILFDPIHGTSLIHTGTGFFINDDGYIITNYHVIGPIINNGNFKLKVGSIMPNQIKGKGIGMNFFKSFLTADAEIIDYDQIRDLALLKLKKNPNNDEINPVKENPKYITLKVVPKTPLFTNRTINDGEHIAMSGYPSAGGNYLTTNAGYIASAWLSDGNYQTDIQVNRGNSGGPVYLIDTGEIIGVTVSFKPEPVIVYGKDGKEINYDELKVFHVLTPFDTLINSQKQVNYHLTPLNELIFHYNSGISHVIALKYVIELAKKNGVKMTVK